MLTRNTLGTGLSATTQKNTDYDGRVTPTFNTTIDSNTVNITVHDPD